MNNCTFSELKTSGEELLYLSNTVAIKICVSEGKFILEIFVTRRIYSYANILLYSSIIEDCVLRDVWRELVSKRERNITGIFFLVSRRGEERFQIIRGRIDSGVAWESRLGLTWNNFQNNTRIRSHCKLWLICILLSAWTDRASENGSTRSYRYGGSFMRGCDLSMVKLITYKFGNSRCLGEIFLLSTFRVACLCHCLKVKLKKPKISIYKIEEMKNLTRQKFQRLEVFEATRSWKIRN